MASLCAQQHVHSFMLKVEYKCEKRRSVCVYAHVLELCHLSVFYVQGLGGLHKCDDPAPHDSEYNEILMIPTPIHRC